MKDLENLNDSMFLYQVHGLIVLSDGGQTIGIVDMEPAHSAQDAVYQVGLRRQAEISLGVYRDTRPYSKWTVLQVIPRGHLRYGSASTVLPSIEKICDTFKSDFSQALSDLNGETPGHFYSFSLKNRAEFVELVELATNKLQVALLSTLPASANSNSAPPAS